MVATDFNGDRLPDLVASNMASDTVSVLVGHADGTFSPAVHYPAGAGPHGLVVADFNGDGRLDVAVASYRDDAVSVLSGNTDGSLAPPVLYPAGSTPRGLTTGDFNNDGKLDLATTNYHEGRSINVLLGKGGGSFEPAAVYAVGEFPVAVVAADLDGDGRLDLAVANGAADTVSVLLGRGDGTFHHAVDYDVGSGPGMIGVGDFNGDLMLDLAVENYGGNDVSVLMGDGDGSFRTPAAYNVGAGPGGLVVSDFNGDGQPDLAVANHNSNDVCLLLGNPAARGKGADGAFVPGENLVARVTPAGIAAADFNGDGRPDLAVINHRSHDLSVLLSQPPAPSFRATAAFTANSSAPLSLTVKALDARNNADTGYSGTVRLTSSDPLAVFPREHAFGRADGGVHVFSVVLKTPGPQTVTVVDTPGGTMRGQALVVVNPAPATQLRVLAPGRVKAGVAFFVEVTALDALGHFVLDYSAAVQLTSTSEAANLSAEYQFRGTENGSHRFEFKLTRQGAYTITATETANSTVRGSVNAIVDE